MCVYVKPRASPFLQCYIFSGWICYETFGSCLCGIRDRQQSGNVQTAVISGDTCPDVNMNPPPPRCPLHRWQISVCSLSSSEDTNLANIQISRTMKLTEPIKKRPFWHLGPIRKEEKRAEATFYFNDSNNILEIMNWPFPTPCAFSNLWFVFQSRTLLSVEKTLSQFCYESLSGYCSLYDVSISTGKRWKDDELCDQVLDGARR